MNHFFQKPARICAFILMVTASGLNLYAGTDWPDESQRINEYIQRCEQTLQFYVDRTDPEDVDRGGLFGVGVNFAVGENIEWAKQRLRTVNAPPEGNMFWMIPMVYTMYTGQQYFDESDLQFIKDCWRTYFPFRGDTENHWLMYYCSLYLACQMFPDSGPEAWYTGKSARENMLEAEEYIRDWIRITTSYGQGEYDSPNYIEEYIRPLALMVGWTEDENLRHLCHMMLDYILVDFAAESLDGFHGGAHSRFYPRYTMQPSLAASNRHAWLLFGQGEFQPNAGNIILASNGYIPPAILYRIAHDRKNPYVQKELKRTRWRLRNAGPDAFEVDGKFTVPVYKYTYVHPDYMLGSSQGGLLQPIQQQTWSLVWRTPESGHNTNIMFGLQPYSSPFEGTMYFVSDWDTVTDLIARSKVDYDSPDKLEGGSPYEQVFQHTSTLIALYDIPEGSRFPHILTMFSRDMTNRTEDESGWIFAKAGPVYLAYKPLAPGEWRPVDWTGLLKGGAGGWFSTNFEEMAKGNEFFVSESLKNGYIVQVAPVSDFSSFETFQAAIRGLPLDFSLDPTPSVTFTSLDGSILKAQYGDDLRVDGKKVDYASWDLYDSPFTHAKRESEMLEIRHGPETRILDFKNNTTTTRLSKAQ